MPTSVAVIFSVALVPYILSWKYILQLIRDVNLKTTGKKISIWSWHKGWRIHREFFPASSIRRSIVYCIGLSVGLGLAAFCVEVRSVLLRQ
jgi:hypothetical protein